MNCEVFQLKELDVEQFEIQEVLPCILHTILFHRALGLVHPKNIDLELFDISYVQCDHVEIERKIDENVTQFINRVKKHPNRKHQICVSFYEAKNKQTSWFTKKVERRYWEHCFYIFEERHSFLSSIITESAPVEREARRSGLEASLREVLFQIIKFGSEKTDHIPSIENLEGASFPFEITISSSSDSTFGMELFKRMLPQATNHARLTCSALKEPDSLNFMVGEEQLLSSDV